MMMRTVLVVIGAMWLWIAWFPTEISWAYREYFTQEQKDQLAKAQTVLVEVIAITDKGTIPAEALAETVRRRLEEVGYTVVADPAQSHDVHFRVKCEQRKTWEGTTPSGGDADLPDSPSRVWKGPACQLNYFLGNTKIKWQKEVRTDFPDAAEAAQAANAGDPGAFAMAKLNDKLAQYDFPVLLAAEWGQADRLLKVLDTPGTTQVRKLKIISLLGEMQADEAFPKLQEALKDKNLAQQAAVALGSTGKESIPILIDMLKNSKDPGLQAAAAKGLGQVGGLNGDATVIPPLLDMLFKPGLDTGVRTEVVWAIGKVPDKRAIDALHKLDREIQATRSDDPAYKKLKEAAFWSLKMTDTELSSENP
ncbi:MAG TPA: HEAT repeat domain-containing protein [Nitrospiraceae bacterium]|nr:HEAT repeat domain-containing protein [Nitrospiraceae bacterium]